ncbi:MAG: arsenate reductase ArsC [Acidobacteriota bacterium]
MNEPTRVDAQSHDGPQDLENTQGLAVLCTGNSCRSQMAEAFFRRHGGDRFTVHSAGTRPADEVHPLACEVMAEVGLPLDGHEPKHLDALLGKVPIDVVVTVCDHAAETCPVWPGGATRLHWPFEDPAAFEGDPETTRTKFREIRDAIERRIVDWLA